MSRFFNKIADALINHVGSKNPSKAIGEYDSEGNFDPYLYKWRLIPKNPVLNIFIHKFLRSDKDEALHDHPWSNFSLILRGSYIEQTQHGKEVLPAGCFKFRLSGQYAHRIEVDKPCWTLFITGPEYRDWGFIEPDGSWTYWKQYLGIAE